jgi:hypothetical protein
MASKYIPIHMRTASQKVFIAKEAEFPALGAAKPASGKPASGKPASGKPASGKPASGKPASGKPAGVTFAGLAKTWGETAEEERQRREFEADAEHARLERERIQSINFVGHRVRDYDYTEAVAEWSYDDVHEVSEWNIVDRAKPRVEMSAEERDAREQKREAEEKHAEEVEEAWKTAEPDNFRDRRAWAYS